MVQGPDKRQNRKGGNPPRFFRRLPSMRLPIGGSLTLAIAVPGSVQLLRALLRTTIAVTSANRGGPDASLRISLHRMQQEILCCLDARGARKGQGKVPKVWWRKSRAAVGRLLRHHLKEELTYAPATFAPCPLTCSAAFSLCCSSSPLSPPSTT